MEKVNVTPRALEEIFGMQKKLMAHYIRIEGLPNYPLDLTSKSSHKTLKDFRGRIIEELSEAYECLLGIWINENDNAQYDKIAELSAFNEEMADVLHFFIETLIFSGLDHGDIFNFCKSLCDDNPGTETFLHHDSPWLTLFHFATYQNMRDGISFNQLDKSRCFTILDQRTIDTERPELAGGRIIGSNLMVTHNEFMWEITFMLNKATSYLRQKDWAQSEMTANLIQYNQSLLEAFLHLFRYMDFMGQNPIGVFTAYYRKNKILQKRIEDGY